MFECTWPGFHPRPPEAVLMAAAPPLVEVEKDHWIECHYDIDFVKKSQVEYPQVAG